MRIATDNLFSKIGIMDHTLTVWLNTCSLAFFNECIVWLLISYTTFYEIQTDSTSFHNLRKYTKMKEMKAKRRKLELVGLINVFLRQCLFS